jgi:hypothetical protein
VFFGAFTGAELLRRDPPDRYVFDDRASYAEETEATVNYLVKVLRLKPDQIAVFAQQDGYGDSGYAGVVKAVRALKRRSRLPLADRLLRLRAILITNTPLRITPCSAKRRTTCEATRAIHFTSINLDHRGFERQVLAHLDPTSAESIEA